ncbi:GDP-mannose 4,6-dehydratase [Prodigiosinella aquatilis]|nr:GDP-mannose 4,6-dehydratase [Prodigiosinella sp. LS101]WJV54606.1 GDP-mannose 4,6-dehydratase [Prodigiosinella sp. LS101]WJV58968.1 GDP-mannose 4,6-dehydratase [Pectobacteriaceae bacterium C111]
MAEQRILITGINGFTGRYMADEMSSAGYRIFGLGTQPSSEADFFQVDLADQVGLQDTIDHIQPDVIIHLAALAFIGHGNANDYYQVNVIGTHNLLECLVKTTKKPQSVLIASSANVYGNRSEGMLAESAQPDPANDYAVSKLSMEFMAHLWMDRLPIVITRPFNYTGIGQTNDFLLPKIVDHFKRKAQILELGNLDVWRDFSDVRALVQAYRRLIENGVAGKVVNVCSGQMHSLREVIALCESITGYHIGISVNSAWVRTNEVKTLCGDATLLRSLIGEWQTPKLEETLRWMLESE